MVFFNYSTMQMAAKIVYYGPGLCGKTTNLHYIYTKTSPQSRGEMVSLETETDRTLFFDLLPIDVGVIGGFKTRLQLYTVPGQVFYNTTRKLVLKGVDGIVFVADSQRAMLEANLESFKNLRENLTEIGLSIDDLPLVVQLNKRDLPNVLEPEAILKRLEPDRDLDHVEGVAAQGTGVFETLKLISKLTLRTLRRRMTGEDPVRPTPTRRTNEVTILRSRDTVQAIAAPSRTMPGVATASDVVGTSAVAPEIELAPEPESQTTESPATPVAVPPPPPETATENTVGDDTLIPAAENLPAVQQAEPQQTATTGEAVAEPIPPLSPSTVEIPESSASVAVEDPPHSPASTVEAPVEQHSSEPEIDFSQSERPAKKPEVKHVKVRSSVDIMAELEALRKRATQTTPRSKKEAAHAVADAASKRDVHRTVTMEAGAEAKARATSVRITVSFEDGEGVLQTEEQSIDLAKDTDVRSLSVDLKIALE